MLEYKMWESENTAMSFNIQKLNIKIFYSPVPLIISSSSSPRSFCTRLIKLIKVIICLKTNKQKRQLCCLAKSSQLCVSFWFKWKTWSKAPWKPEPKVHHATEEYFRAQRKITLRSLLKWNKFHAECHSTVFTLFTPGVAPGPDETWRVSELTLIFKKESLITFPVGTVRGEDFSN